MKHFFVKIGIWLKRQFSKPGKSAVVENETPKIVNEIPIDLEIKQWVGSLNENSEHFELIEVTPEKSVKRIKYEIIVDGKSYWLSKKQRQLYWAICQAHFAHKTEDGTIHGKLAISYYLKSKYTPAEILELEKWEFKPSTHYKTFKQLVKSGIVIRIGQTYKALM